jgi:hypothetical protein
MLEAWFREQDSNLPCWVQSPVSCRLDDPGSNNEKLSWARRDLNPHFSGKSRVRSHYVTDPILRRAKAPGRGTQGIRTLISRIKNPVLYR